MPNGLICKSSLLATKMSGASSQQQQFASPALLCSSACKATSVLYTKLETCQTLLVAALELCLCCSERLQTLFASSVESTQTVATMLAQSGGAIQQSYWTSPQTQKVIEQEEELRSVVFAQMLGATS